MFTKEEQDNFFNAAESLKKYRRADLTDEKGRSLLEVLYTDLLPNDHILKKSLKDNTTFLVGRKGTGKSTIFLRIEHELRKRTDYLPCYIDVKTLFESSQTEFINLEYLAEYLPPEALQKYLIERTFIQNVLKRISEELYQKKTTIWKLILEAFGEVSANDVAKKIESLKLRIEDNEALKEIEIPVVKNVSLKEKASAKETTERKASIGLGEIKGKVSSEGAEMSYKPDASIGSKNINEDNSEIEKSFSSILLQVFQIKDILSEIKDILKVLKIRHVVILLDDFSEIDNHAIKTFVDVLLAPLNNWSEEFIKFKVAAYPNRIHYGKIDPGKIDTINLDFYNLYSEFDRNKMEEGAIDFTKRLIEKRLAHFTGKRADYYFDTSKVTLDEYYELLFQVSMNVPRIIGYVLSYCYQSKIIYDKTINKQDIEAASQRYYEDKIEPFFQKTTYSLLSIDEKIDTLQLKELLGKFLEKLVENKRKISVGEYSGESYQPTFPFSSHFHFDSKLEHFLDTLELNYFLSKYTEMSDKDGQASSVYSINYGLAQKNNLLWGKPKGSRYRKYFIERPFSFNILIKEFLASSKSIHCTNEKCNQTFTQEQLPLLEFNEFRCNKCASQVTIEAVSEDIRKELLQIEDQKLLPTSDIEIVMELSKKGNPVIAKEIAEELDYSSQSVAQKSKMLDLKRGLIKRNKNTNPYSYELTDLAKELYKDTDREDLKSDK